MLFVLPVCVIVQVKETATMTGQDAEDKRKLAEIRGEFGDSAAVATHSVGCVVAVRSGTAHEGVLQ